MKILGSPEATLATTTFILIIAVMVSEQLPKPIIYFLFAFVGFGYCLGLLQLASERKKKRQAVT